MDNHDSPWIIMIHHGESAGRKQTKAMLGSLEGMNMPAVHPYTTRSVPIESP